MKYPKGHVGKRVANLRKLKNLTLPELAEKSGVSKGYISQLENEIIISPSVDTLKKLADAMDVTIADILELQKVNAINIPEIKDKTLEEFLEERRRGGNPVPEDIIRALTQVKTRKKGAMSKEDWAYLCETIYRVTGGK
ncbi:MAG: helix-turn-helix transcriptional regulator [Nitrospirae bacterium]|nr:helix-turn-helix transcriptional regulator [Nitrospirota bacterium]